MRLYNSLTRRKEEFVPMRPGRIGIYVCGPTVYDEPHIGHARSAYIFDSIRRYLEYRGLKVTFVRNVTDVDDKIIEKAAQGEEQVKEVAKRYLAAYHEAMALLGIGRPDKEPKATEYIPKMVKFIELLIKKGCAYEADGDVYFDIKKAKDYGKLSNQLPEKMEAGARISPGEKKRDPLDFALWKNAKPGEPSWPSPWGNGRPGWHIECSVMSSNILGDEFDIHGGGIDLIFPHHENEIAQSEGATGKVFARYWLHNGLLTIKGEKMAKSLGNFVTINDFIARYRDPDYLKLLFLNTHYRHPVDYTDEKIIEMKSQKERFVILFKKLSKLKAQERSEAKPPRRGSSKLKAKNIDEIAVFEDRFEKAMDDDFNTPIALAALFDLVSYTNRFIQGTSSLSPRDGVVIVAIKELILKLSGVFGLDLSKETAGPLIEEREIRRSIDDRDSARRSGDFKKADEIRKALYDKGIILEDTREGTQWRVKV